MCVFVRVCAHMHERVCQHAKVLHVSLLSEPVSQSAIMQVYSLVLVLAIMYTVGYDGLQDYTEPHL